MRWLLGILLFITATDLKAQRPAAPALPVRSVLVSGGMSWPLTHDGITRYWRAGPGAGVEFDLRMRRRFLIGISADVAGLWFRSTRFLQANPGLPLHNIPVAQINIALTGRIELFPGTRLSPFCGVSIGVSRLTTAVYQEVVDSVRVTYFSIPGRSRLSAGGMAGLTYHANRWFGIEAEGRMLYIHNDPDAGLMLLLRAGLRFTI